MGKYLITLLFIVFNLQGIAQPVPFRGTLLFNLKDEDTGNAMKVEDFKTKKVQLLSYSNESELTYDTVNKAFSFTTKGYERKGFAIVYHDKTIFINYPSLPYLKVKVVMPIPLDGQSFSFYNKQVYDVIHSNEFYKEIRMVNLCQGCFLSKTYPMDEATKKHFLSEVSFLKPVELKE